VKRGAPRHETEEQAAAVAQVEPRRREVVRKEPEGAAGEGDGEQGHQRLVQADRRDEHRQQREHRRARRRPVDAVQEVERVGDAHDPQHREGQPDDRAELDDAEGQPHGARPHPGGVQRDGDDDLGDELRRGHQPVDVVHDAEDQDGGGPEEDRHQGLAAQEEQVPHRCEERRETEQGEERGRRDGEAPGTRDGPALRGVHGAAAGAEAARQRGESEPEQQGERERDEVGAHGRVPLLRYRWRRNSTTPY